MARNHSLWPDCQSEKFHGTIGMEEHPDRQPGRAVTVHRRDDDDGETDQNLESDGIDEAAPMKIITSPRQQALE